MSLHHSRMCSNERMFEIIQKFGKILLTVHITNDVIGFLFVMSILSSIIEINYLFGKYSDNGFSVKIYLDILALHQVFEVKEYRVCQENHRF